MSNQQFQQQANYQQNPVIYYNPNHHHFGTNNPPFLGNDNDINADNNNIMSPQPLLSFSPPQPLSFSPQLQQSFKPLQPLSYLPPEQSQPLSFSSQSQQQPQPHQCLHNSNNNYGGNSDLNPNPNLTDYFSLANLNIKNIPLSNYNNNDIKYNNGLLNLNENLSSEPDWSFDDNEP
nr:3262_t:CDS:2 [Entrophospora candida]